MPGSRIDSLDVFRGATVASMILVSAPGTWDAVYRPLQHAAWHGWTPTDLVFPFFLFAMGAAVPVALARRRAAARRVKPHVIRRAVVLCGIGLLLNALESPPGVRWATLRFPGVLQRIALVFAVVAWLTGRTSRRVQVGAAAALLVGYWAVLRWIPVPGFGAGLLTPTGNPAAFLDRAVFGHHLAFPTWDPEGLLSTLPAIATTLCGTMAGEHLRHGDRRRHVTAGLWAGGFAAAALGLLWSAWLPINKNLWTSSFALFSAGLAAQFLAACHWALGRFRWRGWSMPFVALGRNALIVYCLSIGLDSVLARWAVGPAGESTLKGELYRAAFLPWAERCCGAEASSLAYAVAYVALWALVAVALSRRRIFVTI